MGSEMEVCHVVIDKLDKALHVPTLCFFPAAVLILGEKWHTENGSEDLSIFIFPH